MNLNNTGIEDKYSRYQRSSLKFQKIVQNKKAQSFAWLSLTIFTVCFFLIVAIKPTLVTIAKLNKEIKDLNEANQNLQKKINAVVAAQNEFAEHSDDLFLLDQAIPDNSEFPRLAYFLEQATNTEGIQLKSLNLEKIGGTAKTIKTNIPPTIQSLNFSITSNGDYLRLVNFLRDLESSRRILKVMTAVFTTVQKEKESAYELSVALSGQASFGKTPEVKSK